MIKMYKKIYKNIYQYFWLYMYAVFITLGIFFLLLKVLYYNPNEITNAQVYLEPNLMKYADIEGSNTHFIIKLLLEIIDRYLLDFAFSKILESILRIIFNI